MLLQFAQKPPGTLPIAELSSAALRYFDAKLSLRDDSQATRLGTADLYFESDRFGTLRFAALARAAQAGDYARLDPAQAANKSYGMADLGRRCPSVWEITPVLDTGPAALFYFGALLASVALGPLMVTGYPGLFGVRSARLRSEALED